MTDQPLPPQPPASPGPAPAAPGPQITPVRPAAKAEPKRRGGVLRVLMGIFLGLSVVANLVLVVLVVGLMAAVFEGGDDTYLERAIEGGSGGDVFSPQPKIAVISITGIIDESLASAVHRQIERAANDPKVRAVILKINSPGGGLTASDNIHHDVKTLLVDRNKPVIAAMGGVAASGGYYVACSADQIVAQQTTITGSIGVIAQFYFLNGLLKDKLGITPVTLKMGRQKDWPNMFAADMTPEQQDYLLNTLLKPGYDQFVDIVAEARGMRRDKVLELATGRIFMAKEAKQTGLIDEIGYFERAVELAKEKAGVPRARVVEYVQPFNFAELFGASAQSKALFDLKPEKLAALASPKVMYLWTGF